MPTTKPKKIRQGEIERLHAFLEGDIRNILCAKVKIKSEANWKASKFRGEFSFALRAVDQWDFASSRGAVSVVAFACDDEVPSRFLDPALSPDPRAWVTWYEKWTKQPDDSFSLLAAAWTVFWGMPGDDRKAQVLRAEWDQKAEIDKTDSVAANPHWHVDPPLQVSTLMGGPYQALKPVPSEPGGTMPGEGLTMERVHLAMAGWKHQPNAWRHPTLDNTDDLHDWAVRTLEYLRNQRQGFRPR